MKTLPAALVCALALAAGCARAAPPQGRWAAVNGHKIYYELRGQGAPVLLLHGGGDSAAESYAQQLDAFAAHYRLITPEQVGHGHTPGVAGPLSYAGMAEDTAALMEQLHVAKAGVVGFSDGGVVALMLALRHPQLVRRIVISGANISPDGLDEQFAARLRAEYAGPPAENMAGKLAQLWLTHPSPEELSPALLGKLQQPVLVMAGDHDLIKAGHTQLIYRSLPHAQL